MNHWGIKAGAAAALTIVTAGTSAAIWRTNVAQSVPTDTNPIAQMGQDSVFDGRPTSGPTFEPIQQFRPNFFEESQENLDSEIQRFSQERPAPAFGLDSGFMAWQPAIFREGGFSVYVPQGVLTEEAEVMPTAEGELEFDVFAVHSSTRRFVVAYADRPEEKADSTELLDTLRDAVIESTDFEVGLESDAILEGVPGRELQLSDDKESISGRIFLADNRIFLVGVRQLKAVENANLAATFLDSFNLL